MDGDLESDTAVLLEANFVPPTPGSVRDDGVATTVTRDDVQVVRFSVPLDKSVMKNQNVKTVIEDLTQLFSWMWLIPLAIAARSVEVKAASMV